MDQIVDSKSEVVLTTLYFLRNLQLGPNKLMLHYAGLDRLGWDKHSSLLGHTKVTILSSTFQNATKR